jgi:hypothetical protein
VPLVLCPEQGIKIWPFFANCFYFLVAPLRSAFSRKNIQKKIPQKNFPKKIPKKIPKNFSKKFPKKIPKKIPKKFPNKFSKKFSNFFPKIKKCYAQTLINVIEGPPAKNWGV